MKNIEKHTIFLSMLVLSTVMLWFFFAPSNKVKSLIRSYNHWSDPALYQRRGLTKLFFSSTRASKKFYGLLSPDCKVTLEFPERQSEILTRDEFVKGVDKARFMTLAEQTVLDGPAVEKKDNRFLVKMTKSFHASNIVEVADCQLTVEKSGGRWLISQIKQTYRDPKEEEAKRIYALPGNIKGGMLWNIVRSILYNPNMGLGARYLGGGSFHWTQPSFSPDGKKIVFSSLRHKSAEIYTINVDGSNLTRITKTPYWEIRPSFTPDGRSIMFISDKNNYAGEPYLIDIDGSNYRKLVPGYSGVSDARYSPDGNYVAFTVQTGRARDVYIMKSDGTEIRRLTANGHENSSLVFSPDGKKIYFSQRWYDFNKKLPLHEEIYSVNIDGSDLKQLTGDRVMKTAVAATPDYVIFVRNRESDYNDELWLMKCDGTMQKRIVDKPDVYCEGTKLLPDYRHIVLTMAKVDITFVHYLYLKDLFGREKTIQLTGGGDCCRSDVGVSMDGKYIVYVGEPEGETKWGKGYLRIVSLDTGEIKTIGKNY